MPHIQVLDQVTIDKIAAGEVIERPASVVKELVENAIDAGATSVTVEIKDGGISLIRIMDNGCGIEHDEVRSAFLRHSTSKIRTVEDIAHIRSLGFRGEALSSIAAVTQTELITKTPDAELGTRYVIEGGKEVALEETGAPNGTTFLVRQLFYNVPARRKFLKTPVTEAGHIQDLLIHLTLSHPEVSFLFISNGQEKLRTSGSGKLKDVIYQVYGRDVAANLLDIDYEKGGLRISGYLGKPVITRGNRNFENFFVNGRYVKSPMISKSLEDAYRDFTMQHKFPFAVLHFHVDGEEIDVNVHPTKMELRFQRQQEVYNTVFEGVHRRLLEPELIQKAEVPDPVMVPETPAPEAEHTQKSAAPVQESEHTQENKASAAEVLPLPAEEKDMPRPGVSPLQGFRYLGQVAKTYLVLSQNDDTLLLLDQHAMHERIFYEKFRANGSRGVARPLLVPLELDLHPAEKERFLELKETLTRLGFEATCRGMRLAVQAMPPEMDRSEASAFLREALSGRVDDLTSVWIHHACATAIRAGQKLTPDDAMQLVRQWLRTEEPDFCPHGRPCAVTLEKADLEKLFKRRQS